MRTVDGRIFRGDICDFGLRVDVSFTNESPGLFVDSAIVSCLNRSPGKIRSDQDSEMDSPVSEQLGPNSPTWT